VIPEWVRENDAEKAEMNFQAILQRVKVKKMSSYRRIAVAAAIILLIGLATLVAVLTNNHKTPPQTANHEQNFKNDVDPGKYKARLTLADGTVVILDSAETGQLAQQGNTVIVNKDGKIVYDAKGQVPGEVLYNVLSTARGETYATVLADGTKVWLNSASSIKFPVAFTGKERVVEITGEAYFEVAHRAKQPFRVHLPNGSVVEDIGTSFNINSYTDEDAIKTTLIEGSVRVTPLSPAGGGEVNASPDRKRPGVDRGIILKPGQQAVDTRNSLLTTRSADLDAVLAWKNGLFQFNNADIKTVMRQLARWYDIEVVYEGAIPVRKFEGKIQRDLSLADVLEPLAKNQVHFKIEGKRITITP
jgi:ferric-dicitrate binding protein FerR (iron transport regulator)